MKIKLSTIIFILTVVLLVAIVGGIFFYINQSENDKQNSNVSALNKITNNDISQDDIKPQTEEEKVVTLVQEYIKAINNKNWDAVSKYTAESTVSQMKKVEVKNVSLENTTPEIVTLKDTTPKYVFWINWEMGNTSYGTAKDLSMGNALVVAKENNTYTITPFVTGL